MEVQEQNKVEQQTKMEEQILRLKAQIYDLNEVINNNGQMLSQIASVCNNARTFQEILEFLETKNPAN